MTNHDCDPCEGAEMNTRIERPSGLEHGDGRGNCAGHETVDTNSSIGNNGVYTISSGCNTGNNNCSSDCNVKFGREGDETLTNVLEGVNKSSVSKKDLEKRPAIMSTMDVVSVLVYGHAVKYLADYVCIST